MLYVNGKLVPDIIPADDVCGRYKWNDHNPKAFERLSINRSDQSMISGAAYLLPLTKGNAEAISKFSNVTEVKALMRKKGNIAHIYSLKSCICLE